MSGIEKKKDIYQHIQKERYSSTIFGFDVSEQKSKTGTKERERVQEIVVHTQNKGEIQKKEKKKKTYFYKF